MYTLTNYSWAILIYGSVFIYSLKSLMDKIRWVNVGECDSKDPLVLEKFEELQSNLRLFPKLFLVSAIFTFIIAVVLWPVGLPVARLIHHIEGGKKYFTLSDIALTILYFGLSTLFFILIF